MDVGVLVTFHLFLNFEILYADATTSEIFRNHKYWLHSTETDFEESRQDCINDGGYLAIVTDEEEQDFITDFVNSNSGPDVVWIGMRQTTGVNSDLQWLDGSPFVFDDSAYYQNWVGGEPTGEGCVRLTITSGDWKDQTCSDDNGAVCEKEVEQEHEEVSLIMTNFFQLDREPVMRTPLRNESGLSTVHYAMICSAETKCVAVKPIMSGNDVTCELHTELDSANFVYRNDTYVKTSG